MRKGKKIKIKYYSALKDALELRKGGVKRGHGCPGLLQGQMVAPGTQTPVAFLLPCWKQIHSKESHVLTIKIKERRSKPRVYTLPKPTHGAERRSRL